MDVNKLIHRHQYANFWAKLLSIFALLFNTLGHFVKWRHHWSKNVQHNLELSVPISQYLVFHLSQCLNKKWKTKYCDIVTLSSKLCCTFFDQWWRHLKKWPRVYLNRLIIRNSRLFTKSTSVMYPSARQLGIELW